MATDIFPQHLLLIGCGNMAGQMLSRWREAGLDPARVHVVEISGREIAGVKVTAELPGSLPDGASVMLGVKPQNLGDLAPRLAPLVGAGVNLLSILAGTPVATLRAAFPDAGSITRIMPNTPAGLGKGVIALVGEGAPDAAVTAMMAPLGLVEWIASDDLFDAVTALSGSGPAFVFRFIDTFARAAEKIGLPADQAARMALATVEGAAALATLSDENPAELAERVASPGGTTRAGLNVLDAEPGLQDLMDRTLRAARDRGVELAKGA